MKSKKKIILYIALGIAVALFVTLCVWASVVFSNILEKSDDTSSAEHLHTYNESGVCSVCKKISVYYLQQWLCENGNVYASEFCVEKSLEKDYNIKISHEPNTNDVSITYKKYDKSGNDFTVTTITLSDYNEDVVPYVSYNKDNTYKICGSIDAKIYTRNYPLSYDGNSAFTTSNLENKEDLIENTRLLINETIDKANELLTEKSANVTLQDICFEKF